MYFYLFVTLFVVWMVFDAVRRKAPLYWLVVIVLFAPLGTFVYFAVVKLRQWNPPGVLKRAPDGPGIEALRQQLDETPSVANKLALADALEARDECNLSAPLYEDVLRGDPDNRQALHGLGRSEMGRGRFNAAAEHLDRLLRLDNAYRDYAAALDYADALWHNDQRADTIEVMEGLARVSTRINHRVALAHYLTEYGDVARAREVLADGLSSYETSPDFVKKRDQTWAQRAEKMLKGLPA